MTAQERERRWQQIIDKARWIWPRLSDRDVRKARGSEDELYAIIHRKFGRSENTIQRRIALLNI